MQEHKVEIDLDGKILSLESGWLAKQANGCVIVRYGDTMVLVSATMAKSAREGIDFFPLTVDYREKTYAAGRIPGGYLKREARPGDLETLTCRLIDRPIRPMFPDGSAMKPKSFVSLFPTIRKIPLTSTPSPALPPHSWYPIFPLRIRLPAYA